MHKRKTLQELTLKDNFLFAAVMMEQENCRQFLEIALGIEIEHVEINTEKSIVYHPEYRGVRLDVYARDENNTRFNVEMQVAKQSLEKRARYYHSQMDMELLLTGVSFDELPSCYVLFICDFDPFMSKKYRYTVKHTIVEDEKIKYCDGSYTVFLSTKGENEDEVPEQLVNFLKYVASEPDEDTQDFEDEFVSRLQTSVREIKSSRTMGERYMVFEEMLKIERTEGIAEGMTKGMAQSVLELLVNCGEIPEDLQDRIMSVQDNAVLGQLLRCAAKASTVSEFISDTNFIL